MSELTDLEAEAAASRARLHDTIERIQDKLTVSGMVDDFIGQSAAGAKLSGGQDAVMSFLRRHPLPVMIAAAGIGFMIHRMNRRKTLVREAEALAEEEVEVPAINTGRSRVYDPDMPSRHPLADGADQKRVEA